MKTHKFAALVISQALLAAANGQDEGTQRGILYMTERALAEAFGKSGKKLPRKFVSKLAKSLQKLPTSINLGIGAVESGNEVYEFSIAELDQRPAPQLEISSDYHTQEFLYGKELTKGERKNLVKELKIASGLGKKQKLKAVKAA